VTPTSPLKEFAILAGGLLAIVVGLYLLLGLAVDWVAPRIPVQVEKKIAVPFLRTIGPAKADTPRRRYLQRLVDALQSHCAHLPYRVKVHILKAPAVNAVAFPGGNIVVFSGLLQKVASENELVFVLAHELGHYSHRDHLRALGRGLLLVALSTVLLGSDSAIGKLLVDTLGLTQMRFSRAQENRADAYALESLQCIYGHVRGAVGFFARIPKSHDPGGLGHFFASHPGNRRRIAHLKALAQKKGFVTGPLVPLPAGFR